MDVTVLGSGTLLPDDGHHSAAHLAAVDGASILMDCGPGTVHGMDRYGVDWKGVSHLALSHFHTDHTGDVAGLFWAREHGLGDDGAGPFTILGPVGLTRRLEGLARAHGDFILHPGGPLEIVELEGEGRWEDPRGRFALAHHPVPHTAESIGFRLTAGEVTLGYTGDTGPSEDLADFLRGAELIIAECAVLDATDLPNHLSPSSAAALGMVSEPGILVLTHLYPEVDRETLPDLLRSAGYAGRVVVGHDGMRIRLAPGRAELESPSPRPGRP